MDTLAQTVADLAREVQKLRAEADVRRLLGRYMFLCDTPLPEYGMSEQERAHAIGDLFTEDAIWEGVGGAHGAQFGRKIGPAQVAEHMLNFHLAQDPQRVFNTHYVCTEQVQADHDGAQGQWVQIQPWVYDNGQSMLRSSRIHVKFRPTQNGWKIAHYRTENLFIASFADAWLESVIPESVLMKPLASDTPQTASA